MKTGTLNYDEVKPNTAESVASIHLSLFGSTAKISLTKDLPSKIERVEKIAEMVEWNRKQIDGLNECLNDRNPNTFVNLFGKHEEYRSKLRFKHRVRERLLGSFQKAVRELTFIS
jgi:transposase